MQTNLLEKDFVSVAKNQPKVFDLNAEELVNSYQKSTINTKTFDAKKESNFVKSTKQNALEEKIKNRLDEFKDFDKICDLQFYCIVYIF